MTDEPTPELRALADQLFAAGRAERPGPALGRRLLLIEPASASRQFRAPAGGAEPRVSASRAPRALSLWAGVAAAAAIAAGSAGLWWSLGQGPDIDMSPDPASARARPVPITRSQPAQSAQPPAERGAVSPSETTAPGAPFEDSMTSPVAPDAARAQNQSRARAPSPRRAAAPKRLPSRRAANEAIAAASARAASEAAPTTAATPHRAGTVPPAPNAATLGLSEELALLKDARIALRSGQPQRALDVLDRHARARTTDGLHAEATLLRVEALDALGRRAEAAELAERFVRENPFNALTDRARSFIRASGKAP